jgi:hypothetical protein
MEISILAEQKILKEDSKNIILAESNPQNPEDPLYFWKR